jgi:hypothetical protein
MLATRQIHVWLVTLELIPWLVLLMDVLCVMQVVILLREVLIVLYVQPEQHRQPQELQI